MKSLKYGLRRFETHRSSTVHAVSRRLVLGGIDLRALAPAPEHVRACTKLACTSTDAVLASLDAGKPLVDQLRSTFSRETSPIWMDSTTTEECSEITAGVEARHFRVLGGENSRAEIQNVREDSWARRTGRFRPWLVREAA